MKQKIANFNSLSAILDRLSIENVKLSHFEHVLEGDELSESGREDMLKRVEVLHEINAVLKDELSLLMQEAFSQGKYDYLSEQRTFK